MPRQVHRDGRPIETGVSDPPSTQDIVEDTFNQVIATFDCTGNADGNDAPSTPPPPPTTGRTAKATRAQRTTTNAEEEDEDPDTTICQPPPKRWKRSQIKCCDCTVHGSCSTVLGRCPCVKAKRQCQECSPAHNCCNGGISTLSRRPNGDQVFNSRLLAAFERRDARNRNATANAHSENSHNSETEEVCIEFSAESPEENPTPPTSPNVETADNTPNVDESATASINDQAPPVAEEEEIDNNHRTNDDNDGDTGNSPPTPVVAVAHRRNQRSTTPRNNTISSLWARLRENDAISTRNLAALNNTTAATNHPPGEHEQTPSTDEDDDVDSTEQLWSQDPARLMLSASTQEPAPSQDDDEPTAFPSNTPTSQPSVDEEGDETAQEYPVFIGANGERLEMDALLQPLSMADKKLIEVYGDTVHQNDGRYLSGGIDVVVDHRWQKRYHSIVSLPLPLYELPRGPVAKRFLTMFTAEWQGIRDWKWNSE